VKMFRYEVPVNGQPNVIQLQSDPKYVAAKRVGLGPSAQHFVEIWAESEVGVPADRTFQVYGTGHEIPSDAVWRGTTERTTDGLVWHLYELNVTP